ncbi:MAG: hypothetical protein ACI9YT_000415 [Halobacteriales archaeon]|jgi:hypothetical protein
MLHKLISWYKFSHGRGKEMLENGASLEPCPHCGKDTPVYRSTYSSRGEPLSFSVCVWCESLIEYNTTALKPHHPFATPAEITAANEQERQSQREEQATATPSHRYRSRSSNAVGVREHVRDRAKTGLLDPYRW